jgi:outer membrane lipoprotein-sorting protein
VKRWAGVLAALWLAGPGGAAELEPPPPELSGSDVARRAEDTLRSDATYLEATMTVVSPRLPQPREVKLRSWDDRLNKRSFIRILAPPKDAGTGFLKLHPNLWMFVPRVERTLRIPPSMMLQPWMGSDFSNDDLVNESSEIEDYDHRLLGVDPAAGPDGSLRAYVVEYLPHEDAPVVWGRIVAWIEVLHGTPLRMDYYDEAGERLRELSFDQIRPVQGRHFPFRWSMTPLDKKGHETRIEVEEIRFDQTFDEDIFTTRQLKRRD